MFKCLHCSSGVALISCSTHYADVSFFPPEQEDVCVCVCGVNLSFVCSKTGGDKAGAAGQDSRAGKGASS